MIHDYCYWTEVEKLQRHYSRWIVSFGVVREKSLRWDVVAVAFCRDAFGEARGLPEHDAGPRHTCQAFSRAPENCTPPQRGIDPFQCREE